MYRQNLYAKYSYEFHHYVFPFIFNLMLIYSLQVDFLCPLAKYFTKNLRFFTELTDCLVVTESVF